MSNRGLGRFIWATRSDLARLATRSRPRVASVEDSCRQVIEEAASLSRFGDGEIRVMSGGSIRFQEADAALASRLKEVAESRLPGHLVGLPDIFGSLAYLTDDAREYWSAWRRANWRSAYRYFPEREAQYSNAFVSRFYMGWADKTTAPIRYEAFAQLWEGRDVLIVEGEQTFFGCGNDMLDRSASVVRLLCPARSAFTKYSQILESARQLGRDRLTLIALGPTGSVLAFDLHRAGVWAVDVGHFDIEYEWLRMGVQRKTAVVGKDSEAKQVAIASDERSVPAMSARYESQVVARVK